MDLPPVRAVRLLAMDVSPVCPVKPMGASVALKEEPDGQRCYEVVVPHRRANRSKEMRNVD